MEEHIRPRLSHSNSFGNDAEKDTAGCRALDRKYIVIVVELLHCGRQKAVNTLRELQYAELIDIKKQGCGKPNCIYPKSYEAVSNADFKKSDFGTPKV